ncbi:class I SAM-dependent methyltransferase [Rhizobiaceae bacterium n13]|uniref:Class I SAM-dependent methyltransferase n=1 Tax=Ferirhizobium litorale TaxID=2927786 RepID=A0AAE3QBV6_9HYPH|nr:class I SAM-dependent methyltransferase [Fererhizobium litorale]MDI7861682.1 class I SAM-dependent methyltransferase [Fererhizobium litorale]MDI7921976.1 class I SAM-dependent methyltransferase [Fererhizobium litorale]
MSRLDSFIRRLTAQRDILNHVSDMLGAEIQGPVLELGLGNGRTYDHLREKFSGRRIIAFDRAVNSYGPSTPDPENMVVGEISESAQSYLGIGAALVHADIGTGYAEKDAVTLTWLPQLAAGLLAPGGIAVSGLPLDHLQLEAMPLPPGVREGRYFIYRRVR